MTAHVTLDVFSGRPNPSWTLSEEQARTLERLLAGLERGPLAVPPDGLGYRLFRVDLSSRAGTAQMVEAYAGTVKRTQAGRTAYYTDGPREVERWLLETGRPHIPEQVLLHVKSEIEKGVVP